MILEIGFQCSAIFLALGAVWRVVTLPASIALYFSFFDIYGTDFL
jgi:hypothetical protein